MRKTSCWIVLSIVVTAAGANDGPIVAQRLVCGTTTPPRGIEAHEVFREAFLQVALMRLPEWQLQPISTKDAPNVAGTSASVGERMAWRRERSTASISYTRLASIEDAKALLCWHRELIPVATSLVEGFADEAYQPRYAGRGNGHLYYRRGPFFFTVSVNVASDVNNRADTSVPGLIVNPAIDFARPFLAATDEVVAAELK